MSSMHISTPLFSQARLRLTFGYTLFFSVVIVLFSAAFYSVQVRTLHASEELPKVITERMQRQVGQLSPEQHESVSAELTQRFLLVTDELRHSLLRTIVFLDLVTIAVCVGVSYVLAVLSLRPVEASYRQQQQFLQDVSHELRTPLAVIQAEIEVAQRRDKKKSAISMRELLTSLQEEVTAMSNLIDQILQLARLSHTATVEPEMITAKTDLAALVTKVGKSTQVRAKAKKIHLILKATQSGVGVAGETELWEQVLHILLDNAVKYTPTKGEIKVELETRRSWVVLRVSDTGIGISQADLAHIFERFYRADKARSTQGTGLGLSIAEHLVRSVGGSITVSSKVGDGSTFTIQAPKA